MQPRVLNLFEGRASSNHYNSTPATRPRFSNERNEPHIALRIVAPSLCSSALIEKCSLPLLAMSSVDQPPASCVWLVTKHFVTMRYEHMPGGWPPSPRARKLGRRTL